MSASPLDFEQDGRKRKHLLGYMILQQPLKLFIQVLYFDWRNKQNTI